MWLGLLFSMMCLATQFQQSSNEPSTNSIPVCFSQNSQDSVQLYREKTVQCLVLGNYIKSAPYTIPTLILYFTSEQFRFRDTQLGTWVLLAMIIRIALRLGFHRDPSHSPNISPFDGEMQRRVWITIVQLDLATSAQAGLPRMLREELYDTAEPRNLRDADFGEDTVTLPPPRPEADFTQMSYWNAKTRILFAAGKIMDINSSMRSYPYAETMRLDRLLHEAYLTIPPTLRPRPISESIIDPPDILLGRIFLDQLFHKATCVLHRKYLALASYDEQYIYSRQCCITSSLKILQHQSFLDHETQAGGRLHQDRWKLSSLMNYDFLLAATILCVILDNDLKMPTQIHGLSRQEGQSRVDIIRSLSEAYRIFTQASKSSREAHKASRALQIVLQKINQVTMTQSFDTMATSPETSYSNSQPEFLSSGRVLIPPSVPTSCVDRTYHLRTHVSMELDDGYAK